MFYHVTGSFNSSAYDKNRRAKEALVRSRKAHGTIVYCGRDPVGWCQFGPKEELPRIDNKRGYSPTAEDSWRITCLFVAPGHRKSGFASLAVTESIKAMEKAGASTIEAYPVEGSSATLLWSGTPHLFEGAGFSRVRQLGKKSWIYSTTIPRNN